VWRAARRRRRELEKRCVERRTGREGQRQVPRSRDPGEVVSSDDGGQSRLGLGLRDPSLAAPSSRGQRMARMQATRRGVRGTGTGTGTGTGGRCTPEVSWGDSTVRIMDGRLVSEARLQAACSGSRIQGQRQGGGMATGRRKTRNATPGRLQQMEREHGAAAATAAAAAAAAASDKTAPRSTAPRRSTGQQHAPATMNLLLVGYTPTRARHC